MAKNKRAASAASIELLAPIPTGLLHLKAPCALMLLAIALILASRIRLLDAPFERDEGEYAYMGQLMLEGIPPYATAANMKFPGTSAAYALFIAAFGQTVAAVHFGLLVINLATVWLIYLLGRRLLSAPAGIAAAAAYAVLSSGWSVMGMWAHATHFVVLPATGGLLFSLRWKESRRPMTLFWSGLCFGLAILMKQHGFFFAVLAGALLFRNPQPVRAFALFSGAVIAPFLLMAAALWRAGVFDKFWFWTFTYAREYATATPLGAGIQMLFDSLRYVTLANWSVWLSAIAGAVWLIRQRQYLILGLLLTGFLAACPGFYFRDHYFILMLPAVALCTGAAVNWAYPVMWAVTITLLFSVFEQREFLFRTSPVMATSTVYGENPFPEALEVGKYIQARATRSAKIAVLGSEPELYFYSHRRSATPFLYAYPLMEAHPFARQMQADFIHDIESVKPEYVVVVNVKTSWLRSKESHTDLFEWWLRYGPANYEQVGVADIFSKGTDYVWDGAAANYRPRSGASVQVFRRRPAVQESCRQLQFMPNSQFCPARPCTWPFRCPSERLETDQRPETG